MANVYAYIENIKNFDITTIKEKQIKKITNSDIKNYTVDEAKAKSLAAAQFMKWLNAVVEIWNYQKPKILLE